MKEPRKSTVGELFSGDVEYFVPRYQRTFDWKGESEVSDLIQDLIAATESKSNDNLYLGPVIFDVSEEKASTKIEIIDGQQRITTLLILLMAMRDFARIDLSDESVAQSLQKHISNSDALSMGTSHRLTPSPVIGRIFPLMSDYSWDGKFPAFVLEAGKRVGIKREVNRVKSIYQFCRSQIEDIAKADPLRFKNLARHLRDKTFVIKIEIEDRAEAFEVFERTNARGKGLEVADLLKNYIFSKEDDILADDLDQLWDDITQSFGGSQLKALKQFWVARAGKVNARELYRNLRVYAEKKGVNDFLQELKDFADFYQAFHSDDPDVMRSWLLSIGFPKENMLLEEFRRSVGVLKLFNITQPLPLIYSTCRSFRLAHGDKKEAKRVLTLLRSLEYFHFVNNKVGGRIGNESENAYAQFGERIYREEKLESLSEVAEWFKANMLNREEFAASFASLSYENKPDRNVIRYVFDRLANEGVKDGQSLDLLDLKSAQHGVRSSFDIEHLAAQSLIAEGQDTEIYHSIGNLIVIPKQINGILSNKSFSEKMAVLSEPHKYPNNIKHVPSYLQAFVAEFGQSDWDQSDIKARTDSLAKASYEVASTKARYA
ncbi:DUF262 domain-containing protein [Altererythrobacter aurantiacus]|uniref:DUF262 domain-containing protein n=1 Tax=Parapontixanthobacter aurantiacus TaxID=1463599 RepID=A0A844ZGI3_9SPHN|nr:DUF262 domain-containing protein [Parapontixanthobacter aurantiacus]MXO86483.1 DUF262 domain-containing protein [Parapontixanthobacter aurantiacus]